MGSTPHLSGRDPAIAMLQVEGCPWRIIATSVYFRGACMSPACCSVKLTGLGGQSRMLCEPRGPPARPPSYENTQTRAQALAAWSRSLYRASWSFFPSGECKLHYRSRAVHHNCGDGGGYGRSVVLSQDNNTTTQSDLLHTASEGILR